MKYFEYLFALASLIEHVFVKVDKCRLFIDIGSSSEAIEIYSVTLDIDRL